MASKSIVSTIKEAPALLKKHWKHPFKDGWSLNIKEIAAYCIGGMGASGVNLFLTFYTITTGMYIAAATDLDVTHVLVITIINSVFGIIRSPIVSWLIDNVQTKLGKFRPWLIWLPIPCTILMLLMGWIPQLCANNYWTLVILLTLTSCLFQTCATIYWLASAM